LSLLYVYLYYRLYRRLLHGLDKMNSLNILSARVSPPSTPAPSRSNSYGTALSLAGATDVRRSLREDAVDEKDENEEVVEDDVTDSGLVDFEDEKTPLLEDRKPDIVSPKTDGWFYYPKWVATAFINSVRWVVSAIMAPGFYIVGCLYDEMGRFAPFYQMGKFGRILWPSRKDAQSLRTKESAILEGKSTRGSESSTRRSGKSPKRPPVSNSSSSGLSSESESDHIMSESDAKDSESGVRHARSKSLQSSNEIAPARRSIRIKLHNEESLRHRKHRKSQSIASTQSNGSGAISVPSISPETLKSPTSPAAASLSMTKYPRAPAPPRPLIPRRLPSYTLADPINGKPALKTLILDLDETLIHSMAKGGRMSTGHMVEVKLNTYIGGSGQQVPGPQHPILYYVHKRPHCDDFLRRVSTSIL
jgi:CTD nuclear envelope phosphatase 1